MNYVYGALAVIFLISFIGQVADSYSRFNTEGEYMTSRIQAFLSSLACLFLSAAAYSCFSGS